LAHSQTKLVVTQPNLIPEINAALSTDAFLSESSEQPQLYSLTGIQESQAHQLSFHWQNAQSESEPLIISTTLALEVNASSSVSVTGSSDGLLMYTSGTTGRPKGVVLSHANLLAGGANVSIAHELKSTDRALCVLPLFHINGLCVTLLGPLVSGGSVVMPNRF